MIRPYPASSGNTPFIMERYFPELFLSKLLIQSLAQPPSAQILLEITWDFTNFK